MTQKKYPPLREMFAALPEGTLSDGDNAILKTLSASMHALREPVHPTSAFTVELRGIILSRLKQCVAEVLDPHIPRQVGRPRTPLKREIEVFKEKLALLSIDINEHWHKPAGERPLAGSRAALDNAFTTLLKQAQALGLDTDSLTDTWSRLVDGIDAYATRTFSEAPIALVKSTAGAQMNLVLKILLRDAAGKRI